MSTKIIYVHTQDGLVTKVEDSNWNDITPSTQVAKVAEAISGVSDGCTEVSVVENSDHAPYAMAYVGMKTVGNVVKDIGLFVECYANSEDALVMMHLKVTSLPHCDVIADYTMLPVNGEITGIKNNVDRLIRHVSTLIDLTQIMGASIDGDEVDFFDGKNLEKIKVYAKKTTPQVVIYQDDPKQDVIDRIAEVFEERTLYVGDDVTIQFN